METHLWKWWMCCVCMRLCTIQILLVFPVFQGMGYLHAKGIVHKDLKSKNVFHDTNKVIITDFGLFGISGVVQEGRYVTALLLITWIVTVNQWFKGSVVFLDVKTSWSFLTGGSVIWLQKSCVKWVPETTRTDFRFLMLLMFMPLGENYTWLQTVHPQIVLRWPAAWSALFQHHLVRAAGERLAHHQSARRGHHLAGGQWRGHQEGPGRDQLGKRGLGECHILSLFIIWHMLSGMAVKLCYSTSHAKSRTQIVWVKISSCDS